MSEIKDNRGVDRFVSLLTPNQRRIQAFIYMLIPNINHAEDIYQETLVEMWNKYYTEVLLTHVGLNSMEGISCLHEADGKAYDPEVWQALLQQERTAKPVAVSPEEPEKEPVARVVYPQESRRISRWSLAAAVCSAAALLFLALVVRFAGSSSGHEVVTLVDCVDARWGDESIVPGARLSVEGGWVCNTELPALPYDYNGDCIVDLGDFAIFAVEWLSSNRINAQ